MFRAKECAFLVASCNGDTVELVNEPRNVAAYIAAHTGQSMSLRAPDKTLVLSTYGFFTDRCSDMNYYGEIMEKLVPLQKHLEEPAQIEYYSAGRQKHKKRERSGDKL